MSLVVSLPSPTTRRAKPRFGLSRSRMGIEYCVRGDGLPVLAIHGSPGGYDHATLFFDNLADSGFTLVTPSRPGFLGTPLELGRTIAEQADLIIGLVDELAIDSFFLCGFSCGGAISVRIAAQYPERVRGMILEAPVAKAFSHGCTDGLHGKLLLSDLGSAVMRRLIDFAPRYSIERLLERQGDYDRAGVKKEAQRIFEDDEKRRYALSVLERCMPASRRAAGMLNDSEQLGNFANEDLERVQCPTLVIHGSSDGEVPMDHGEHAALRIRNARLMVVPEACHLLCLSPQWERVQGARVSFFRALAAGCADPFALALTG